MNVRMEFVFNPSHSLPCPLNHQTYIVVTDTMVSVISRETGRAFANFPVALVEQVQVLEATKPKAFAFSHHSTRLGVDYISVFEIKNKYLPFVEPALRSASRTEKLFRRSSVKMPGLSLTARVVGCHAAHFLGSIPVAKKTGTKVVAEAVDTLRRKNKKSGERPLFVTLVCSRESITYVEALTDDILHESHMSTVSYVAIVNVGLEKWGVGGALH